MATQEAADVPAALAPTWDTSALSVVYGTGLAVAVTDRSGRLSRLSPALERLLHQPFRPVTADEFPDAFHLHGQGGNVRLRPEDVPLCRAATTRSPQTGLLCLKVPGLPPRHLLWNAFPLTTDSGVVARPSAPAHPEGAQLTSSPEPADQAEAVVGKRGGTQEGGERVLRLGREVDVPVGQQLSMLQDEGQRRP
jgi:hypothetical protein